MKVDDKSADCDTIEETQDALCKEFLQLPYSDRQKVLCFIKELKSECSTATNQAIQRHVLK